MLTADQSCALQEQARSASHRLKEAIESTQLDLAGLEAGLDEARRLGRTLEGELGYADGTPDPFATEAIVAFHELTEAVLTAYPPLQNLEADMLEDLVDNREASPVTPEAIDRVSTLRGRSLRVSMTLHRGLHAAYRTHQVEEAQS